VIGIVVLVAGFSLLKLMLDVRRITPATSRDAQTLAQASPTPVTSVAATAAPITAPRALPADGTPAPTAPVLAAVPQPAVPSAQAQATIAAASAPAPASEEPEVRRAEPVNPEDLVSPQTAVANAAPGAETAVNNFDIRPLRKTYVRIVVDGAAGPAVERWLSISEAPLQFRGQKLAVKVLDPAAVEIRKNGKVISRGDADVRLE
jgi:hypothetical protein